MASAHADRNLLLGLLALQMDFITRDDWITALQDWTTDKSRSMSQVLRARGLLTEPRCTLLEALVAEHLAAHGPNLGRNLAATIRFTAEAFSAVPDPMVRASLAILSTWNSPADQVPDTRPPETPDTKASQRPRSETRERSALTELRYRPLRPHARGGIGEVFVARDEELNREVALKELQDGLASRTEARTRFMMEAEITGCLEHPGIVPVYGLGCYPDGRPYYAMRFIRGQSFLEAITAFHAEARAGADVGKQRLALRNLLGRFVAVCNSVAYAHSRGVLHRDLKPANVMLGKFGETLVVDWGLAKVLAGSASEDPAGESVVRPASARDSAQTEMGQVIGTPAYMSPEQAQGRPQELGPASDVYSLGAILYHLLTGTPPFSRGGLTEVLARVRDGAFLPPRQLRKEVPSGLEAICLKAMANRPTDRYPSAKDVAEEVERWLADEPVKAHRESAAARLRRWGRRHRPLVTGLVALLMTASLALWLSTFFLSRAWEDTRRALGKVAEEKEKVDKAREKADAETLKAKLAQEAAEHQARAARQTANFLIGMFASSDPIGFGGVGFRFGKDNPREMTAQQLLDRGRLRLDHDAGLKEEPVVRAALLDTLGNVYRSMALYGNAEVLLNEALRVRREQLGENDLDTAATLHNLGWLLHDLGDYDKARSLYQEALTIRLNQLGAEDPLVMTSKFHLAWVLADDGDYAEAEKLFKEVIAFRQTHFGKASREAGIALGGLVGMLIDQGRYQEAFLRLPELAAIIGKLPEGEDILQALQAFQTGMTCKGINLHGRAQDAFREALRLTIPRLGESHPYVGLIRFELADDFEKGGDLAQAESLYRNCLQIVRTSVGIQHPRVIALMNRLAPLLYKKGKKGPDEARQLLAEFREARQKRFGANHRQTIEATALFGLLEEQYGDDKRAEPLLQEAVAGGDRASKEPVWLSNAHFYLGRLQLRAGRPAEAEPHFRRSLDLDRAHKPGSEDVPIVLNKLATALMDQKKFPESEPLLKEALALCAESRGWRQTRIGILKSLARLYQAQGDGLKAEQANREAEALRQSNPRPAP